MIGNLNVVKYQNKSDHLLFDDLSNGYSQIIFCNIKKDIRHIDFTILWIIMIKPVAGNKSGCGLHS